MTDEQEQQVADQIAQTLPNSDEIKDIHMDLDVDYNSNGTSDNFTYVLCGAAVLGVVIAICVAVAVIRTQRAR